MISGSNGAISITSKNRPYLQNVNRSFHIAGFSHVSKFSGDFRNVSLASSDASEAKYFPTSTVRTAIVSICDGNTR